MRVMVMIKADEAAEAGQLPDGKLVDDMLKYNEELVRAGVMLAGEGLHPTSRAVKVKWEAGEVTVVDGPFAEAKEVIAGYWLWEVRSMEEAVEWVKRMPAGEGQEGSVEIRPIHEMAEFGEHLTEEQRAKDDEIRSKLGR